MGFPPHAFSSILRKIHLHLIPPQKMVSFSFLFVLVS